MGRHREAWGVAGEEKSAQRALSSGLAGLTGLEPATYGVTGRHSNRLSYNPLVFKAPFLVGDDGLEPPTCCV